MYTFGIAPGRSARRRAAAAFAAVGALLFSSGLVIATAPAATAATVGVCHATGSDTNPYTFVEVDDSSTTLSGHLPHATDSGFEWKNGTWWNGVWHPAGSKKPDLIFGQNYDTTITKALCDLRGTDAISVKPSVDFQDPTCANGNVAAWSGTSIAGVTYTASGAAKPKISITVTAALDPGYVLSKDAQTSFSHTFGDVQDCRGAVAPVAPTVEQPGCPGPGSSPEPTVTLAEGPAGVTYAYDEATHTVTATADADHKFAADLPAGWTRVDDDTATYHVTVTQPADCRTAVSAVAPSATPNTCLEAGHLVLPSTEGDGYHWTGDTTDAPGAHTVTAVADQGYTLTGQTEWTVSVKAAGEGLDCQVDPGDPGEPAEVTAAAPSATDPTCTTDGHLVLPDSAGDGYDWTGDTADAPGAHTVTAVPQQGFVLTGQTRWTVHVKAAGEGLSCQDPSVPADPSTPATPTPEPIVVSPLYPSATEATCSADGELMVPEQPAGVIVTQTGTAPGDVTFTFAPAQGYVFPVGTDTEVTVTVPAQFAADSEECLLGEESLSPSPKPSHKPTHTRTPVVLGTQAAVPTAVDAGLAGTTAASSSGSPLGQALVAGGLLMLVAGASLGLGRRTRGAHES